MILKINSRGEQVKVIQEYLEITADGIFGPITHQAVLKFQKENNLIVDGIVGPQTWEAMAAATTDNTETKHCTDSGIIIHEHHLDEDQYFENPTVKEGRSLSEAEVSRSKRWIFLHHTAGWNNPYKVIDSWGRDKRGKVVFVLVFTASAFLPARVIQAASYRPCPCMHRSLAVSSEFVNAAVH